nr:helix-turn-helix transcriptional regulator [uncultured Rhodoferax sp.]
MTANTIEELEIDLGDQIKSLRLRQNIERTTLASRAGCSVSALKNLESGNGSTLRTLIAIVRTLGRDDWLRNVAPMATISPLNMPKAGGTRQRARASKK